MSTNLIIKYFLFCIAAFLIWVFVSNIYDDLEVRNLYTFFSEFFLLSFSFISGLRLFLTFFLTLGYLMGRADVSVRRSLGVRSARAFIWDEVFIDDDSE